MKGKIKPGQTVCRKTDPEITGTVLSTKSVASWSFKNGDWVKVLVPVCKVKWSRSTGTMENTTITTTIKESSLRLIDNK